MFSKKEYAKGFIKYCEDKIKRLELEFIERKGNVRKHIEEIESWEETLKRAKEHYKLIIKVKK